MGKIKYCKNCSITKENMKGAVSQEVADFGAGYLIGFNENIKNCPFCNGVLINIPISDDDFLCIRKISNNNRKLLEAMIRLYQDDIIEYELKMSQFRTQVQQQESSKAQNDYMPRCPHCKSTNIKPISALNRGASIAMWGIFSKKINKSFECINCKYTW